MTYKRLPFDSVMQQEESCIQRMSDNVLIPFDPANRDYQEYLEWVADGNTPEPAEEVES